MATRRFQINIGENAYNITETVGLATVNKNIELTVDFDAAVPGNATTGRPRAPAATASRSRRRKA